MKKTLLALATASSLIVSGSALAAFADAAQGEGSGGNAQIKIAGIMTNTNPNWMWQIPAAVQGSVTDVALKQIAGVSVGDNTEFAISKTQMSILEGYMKTPSPTGVAGITPVITIGGQDVSAVACSQLQGGCKVEISATDAGAEVGKVIAHVEASAASASKNANGSFLSPVSSTGDISAEAIAVLKKQSSFANTYPNPKPGNSFRYLRLEELLRDPSSKNISDSRVVKLLSSKIVVPTDAVPATWAATLPITISLK